MFKLRSNCILTAVAVLAAIALPLTSVYAQQQVGTAGAVNPAADASGRVLQVGSNVLFRERINTTSSGSLQLVFVDKTTLSIGPNSNLVIDEFVYNPNAGTGRMTVSLAKGLLRIVGGNVTHTEGATIKTPAATVGIRGGVQTTSHVNGTTNVINHFGKSTVTSGGTTQTIYRPGFGSSVGSANTPPSTPAVVPQSVVNNTMQQLTSTSGQSGGAPSQPSNATATSAGLGQTNANLIPSQVQSLQGQTVSQSAATLPPTTTTVAAADQIAQDGQQEANTQQTAQATAPAPVFFALQTTGVPYLPPSGFTTPGMYVSPLFGYRPGGVLDNGEGRFGSATLQAGLAISEDGFGDQASTFFVMSGGFISLSADGSDELHGAGFRATTRLAADQAMGAARGSADSVPGTEVLNADRIPTAVTLSQDSRNLFTGAVVPETAFFFNPNTNYTYSNAFTQVPVPAGVGEVRSGVQLTGFVGGVMRTRHAASIGASSSVDVGPSYPVVGGVVIDFSLQRPQFQAVATIDKVANFNGDANEFMSAVLQVGNLATTRGRGAFIDDNLFGGREGINEPPGVEPQTQVSTVNGTPARRTGQAFATSQLVNAEGAILALDPGATFCVCEYTRWGAWSVDSYRTNADMTTEERDRAHIILWVAGRKSNPVDIPLTGTATYNGYMAGTIRNITAGHEYLSGSNFSYTANFGAPATSSMSVADLDGVTYSGTLPFVRATNTISGSITGTNVGVGPLTGSAAMNLEGAFFKGKTDPVKDVAGRFHITGNPSGPSFNYIGGGIFAGSR